MSNKKAYVKVLKKMCEIAGHNYNEIDWAPKNMKEVQEGKLPYFDIYTWTLDQEHQFKKWFINAILTDRQLRVNLSQHPIAGEKDAESLASQFIAVYGFRNKKH